jgi:hypothetical protein
VQLNKNTSIGIALALLVAGVAGWFMFHRPAPVPQTSNDPCGDQRALAFGSVLEILESTRAQTTEDLRHAVDRLASQRGTKFFACPVCAKPFLLNPSPRQWTMEDATEPSQLAIFCSCEHTTPENSSPHAAGTTVAGQRIALPTSQTPPWLKTAVSAGG